MNRKQLAIAFGVVALVLVGIVVLLVTGGAEPVNKFQDPPEAGGAFGVTPDESELADIELAQVRAQGDQIVFEARLGTQIPKKLKNGALTLRWELSEDGVETWLVTADLDVGRNASIVGLENDYGASSVLKSLPGEVEVTGARFIIRIDPTKIPDFPERFNWRLESTFDRLVGAPGSAVVTDAAPKEGFGEFTGRPS